MGMDSWCKVSVNVKLTVLVQKMLDLGEGGVLHMVYDVFYSHSS